MTQRLRIRLFGAFEVERDGDVLPESAWHTQQAKQVLKILILARGRAVPSDRLMEWLWPGANPAATSTTLRSTVHALRRALEPDRAPRVPSRYIVTRSPGYAFQPDAHTWVDVYAFEDLLEQAARTRHAGQKRRLLVQALDLYRGDLLEEDLYADWALLDRERLREQYLDALLELAELYAQAGEIDRAIVACRRALARDEYREPVYRALMRYQVLAGDVAAALSTYERCRTMLQEEFGAEPAPQTQALYQAILRGDLPAPIQAPVVPAVPTSPETPPDKLLPPYDMPFDTVFVGRERELQHVLARFQTLSQARGGALAVTGEMGMGKTRFVLQALRQAPAHINVLGVRCLAVEQDLPFAPLTNALRRLLDTLPPERLHALPPFALAQLAQLIPALHYTLPDLPAVPQTTPEENRSRLIDGIANVLIALSDQRPLVLFLDDIQWADEATLTTLGRLAYRAVRHPLLLLLTYPSDALTHKEDVRNVIIQLRHDGVLDEITLDVLTEADVRQFLSQIWHRPEDEVASLAHHVYEHTEGVPLYLVEMLREVRLQSDTLPRAEHLPEVQSLAHIRALILSRVERLSVQARDVLALAAVIGREFALDVLETAALSDPLPGLEELLRHQFLHEQPDGRIMFAHDVVRQVVYGSISTLARRRLHRQVADALIALYGSDAGPHAVNVAYHYRHAGPRHALAALRYTVLAGDYLRHTYGFRRACEHYRRALQLAREVLPDEQAQEWIRRAYVGSGLAYEALGDWEGIVTTYTALHEWAEQQGNDELALQAARRLISALTVVGRLDDAAMMAGDVLAFLSQRRDAPLREIYSRLRVVFGNQESDAPSEREEDFPHFHPAPPVEGAPWVDVAQRLGEELAPLPLSLYGWSLALQGHLDAADACLSYVVSMARGGPQTPYAVMAEHFRAHVAFLRGDVHQLQAHLDEGFRLARQMPMAEWSTLWGQVFEGYIHLHMGDSEGARQRFAALEKALAERQAFRSHYLSARTGLTLVALAYDDLEEAIAHLDTVLAQRESLDVVSSFWTYVAEATIARRQGDGRRALERARQALRFAGRRGLLFEYVAAAEEYARASVASGEPHRALPVLEEALARALKTDAAGVIDLARRAHARLQAQTRASAPAEPVPLVSEENNDR